MKISSAFLRKLVSRVVKRTIRKKLGYNIDIDLNGLEITFDDNKAKIRIDAGAEMSKEELTKLVKKIGL